MRTEGTRCYWTTLAQWLEEAIGIEKRRVSSATYQNIGRHRGALAENLRVIKTADDITLAKVREFITRPSYRPPAGQRRGTAGEIILMTINNELYARDFRRKHEAELLEQAERDVAREIDE